MSTNENQFVKQGAAIGGWVCFILGCVVMYFSLWTFILYVPLLFAAFALSIVAMAQRRIVSGLILLLATVIIPAAIWFTLFYARTKDKFADYERPKLLIETEKPTPTPSEASVAPSASPDENSKLASQIVLVNLWASSGDSWVAKFQNNSDKPIKAFKGTWNLLNDFKEVTKSGDFEFTSASFFERASGLSKEHVVVPGESIILTNSPSYAGGETSRNASLLTPEMAVKATVKYEITNAVPTSESKDELVKEKGLELKDAFVIAQRKLDESHQLNLRNINAETQAAVGQDAEDYRVAQQKYEYDIFQKKEESDRAANKVLMAKKEAEMKPIKDEMAGIPNNYDGLTVRKPQLQRQLDDIERKYSRTPLPAFVPETTDVYAAFNEAKSRHERVQEALANKISAENSQWDHDRKQLEAKFNRDIAMLRGDPVPEEAAPASTPEVAKAVLPEAAVAMTPGPSPSSASGQPAAVQATPASVITQSTPAPVKVAEVQSAMPQPTAAPQTDGAAGQRLSASDISALDLSQVQYAIDQIFGKYGTEFQNHATQAWANRQPWYHRVPGRTTDMADGMFTPDEKANVELLSARRDALRAGGSPPDANGTSDAEMNAIKKFVASDIKEMSSGDVDAVLSGYADKVAYYDSGLVDRDFVESETKKYLLKWPVLRWNLTSDIGVEKANATDRRIHFTIAFDAENPSTGKVSKGNASENWTLRFDAAGGDCKIIAQNEEIIKRAK